MTLNPRSRHISIADMGTAIHRLWESEIAWQKFVEGIARQESDEDFKFECPHFQELDKLLGEGKHA